MSRTFRSFKYIFLQAQVIFALVAGLGLFLLLVFEGFLNFENGFQIKEIINAAAFNILLLGILFVGLTLGSYYQLLCPFYLAFSTTRKGIYLSMKVIAWLPVLELFLLSLILLTFADSTSKTTVISSYAGITGIALIALSFGEFMGVLSLRFAKFGRIFPAILGGIGGGIGGFCSSFFADVESVRTLTIAVILERYAHIFLITGIALYLITNIAVYRIIRKLSVH